MLPLLCLLHYYFHYSENCDECHNMCELIWLVSWGAVHICRSRPVTQSSAAKVRTRRSAAVTRIPRHITAAALKHFTGMRVDAEAVDHVEEMW